MQSDPALQTALVNQGYPSYDNAFDIAYHMYWPSASDPWNLANPQDNLARKNYYNVTGTPTMKCDGLAASWTSIASSILSRSFVASPLWMDLEASINAGNLDVTVTAVANTNISGNYTIHIVLMERYVYLLSPNGQHNHYHPMLDMEGYPGVPGQAFAATAGDTVQYYATFTMDPSWEIDNLDIATFVQYNTTKEFLQGHCEMVPVDFPNLVYESYTLEDNGNNDGRAEPGEEAYMYVTLSNGESYQTAINVVGTLSTDDPDLTVTTPTVNFPDILNGSQGTNVNPFVFDVSPTAEPHLTTLHLEVTADPQQTLMTADIEMYIGWPDVLLIDDDGAGIIETYYQSALQALNKSYENWDIFTQGVPTLDMVDQYPIIIWLTGWATTVSLDADERVLVEGYLDAGGNLFLSGQSIAQGMTAVAPAFLQDVLHASLTLPNTGIKELTGYAGNPVGDGMSVDCNPGGSGSGTCTSPDGITVLAPAEAAFGYDGSTHDGALTYEDPSTAKLVFFSFPFEAINGVGGTNTREDVLTAILEYFDSPVVPPSVTITLTPYGPPILIPASGGSFDFNIEVANDGVNPETFDIWSMVTLPNGSEYGPIINVPGFTAPASWSGNRDRTQLIPAGAPTGMYTYDGYVGTYPDLVLNEDHFDFEKLAAGDGNLIGSWANTGEAFDEWLIGNDDQFTPVAYSLAQNHPNPFNPTTTISFDLPEPTFVTLRVYDVSGRQVAELANGYRSTGTYDVTFDASGLASGIYMYRLDAGAFNSMGKMVLMK